MVFVVCLLLCSQHTAISKRIMYFEESKHAELHTGIRTISIYAAIFRF